jgi:hypothetical protein
MKASKIIVGAFQYVAFSCDEVFIFEKPILVVCSLLCSVKLGNDYDFHLLELGACEIKE